MPRTDDFLNHLKYSWNNERLASLSVVKFNLFFSKRWSLVLPKNWKYKTLQHCRARWKMKVLRLMRVQMSLTDNAWFLTMRGDPSSKRTVVTQKDFFESVQEIDFKVRGQRLQSTNTVVHTRLCFFFYKHF